MEYAGPASGAPSLGTQAARGAVWATAPAVLAKLTGFIADIALAWFLTRSDFGAVGLAVAVAALFGVIQQAGLRDILTQRQKRFGRWATPAFWMALTLGVACSLTMAASAPLAARLFDVPALKGLVLLLSVRCVLDALAVVPQAKLQIQLRYRAIGGVAAVCTLLQAGLSVLLASKWFGWGPYAMCAPMVVTSAVQATLFWVLARPGEVDGRRLRMARWRWLSADAGFAMATGLVTIAVGYGDNAVLGLFRDEAVVGTYFFAYRLAVQANQLLVTNLSGVLFSALSQLGEDRQRQLRAAMAATKLLAVVAVQVLSIGMALVLIGAPGASLIKAQGRFGTFFFWSASISAAYLLIIGSGAALGGAVGVATAAAVYYGIFGPAGLRVGFGRFPGFWRDLAEAYLAPLLLGGAACAVAVAVAEWIPVVRESDLLSIAWIVAMGVGGYAVLVRVFLPARWRELRDRFVHSLLTRRRAA